MIAVRSREDRGRTRLGWLDSYHTFSFNQYHDPEQMGFRSLRVLNEDYVVPGGGFGTHGHRDMEILSYVLEGALRHEDSTGGGGVMRPLCSSCARGPGVTPQREATPRPARASTSCRSGSCPSRAAWSQGYDHKPFAREAAERGFVLLASRAGRDESLADRPRTPSLLRDRATGGRGARLRPGAGRHAWRAR